MHVIGLGVDATEISRFRAVLKKKNQRFLSNTFSASERAYCASFKDPAPHFAGLFAAKEAARKASGAFLVPLSSLEILPDKKGKPEVWISGKRSKELLISITHSRSLACATALRQKL